jgi:hypothetical protein
MLSAVIFAQRIGETEPDELFAQRSKEVVLVDGAVIQRQFGKSRSSVAEA